MSESSLVFLLIRTAIPLNQDATFGPHLTLITCLVQIQCPRGFGLQHVNFGKMQTFSPYYQQTVVQAKCLCLSKVYMLKPKTPYYQQTKASLVAQRLKRLPAMQETRV